VVTPSGAVTEFPLTVPVADPIGIVAGPDKNLWFTEHATGRVGRITPGSGAIVEYPISIGGGPAHLSAITSDAGYLYATDTQNAALVRITTHGLVKSFPVPDGSTLDSLLAPGPLSSVWAIGADAQLWQFNPSSNTFTPSLTLTSANASASLVSGLDGNLWLTDQANSIDTYVIRKLSTNPTSVAFTAAAQTQSVTVSATSYTGTFYAQSSNPTLTSVSPSSGSGTFTITGNVAGNTTISFSDMPFSSTNAKSNIITVPVSLVNQNVVNAGQQANIKHIVLIVQENRTPDNLFQGLPGADIATSGLTSTGQTVPLHSVPLTAKYDIAHTHAAFVAMYDNGRMDGANKEMAKCGDKCPANPEYGYVPATETQPYLALAEKYAFADRMFATQQGPSFPAHQYLIAGTSETGVDSGLSVAENPQTPGGNPNSFSDAGCEAPKGAFALAIDAAGNENYQVYPCFDHPTLMDLLDDKGISWRFYANDARNGIWAATNSIKHLFFGADQSNVVTPPSQILNDISAGNLAQVTWLTPTSKASDHAGVTDGSGPDWVASVVNAIGNSPYWSNTAVFITWDDWGGWYDHVAPPIYTSYELGFRVPLIVVSPFAISGYVSHQTHEFGSILKYIEEDFNLGSLGYTDNRADDLEDCFNYSQTPITFAPIPSLRSAHYFTSTPRDFEPVDY
jgi:phospholipase C